MTRIIRRDAAAASLLTAALMCSAGADARPQIAGTWADYYGPSGTSGVNSNTMEAMEAATGARCQVCHVNRGGGEPWNRYGWSIRQTANGGNYLAAFIAVEGLDADGNGDSNIAEIMAGAQPGWTTSGNISTDEDGNISPIPNQNIPAVSPLNPVAVVDTDSDGVADDADNCLLIANGPLLPDAGGNSQLDTDGDSIGNACDADIAVPNDCSVEFADLNALKLAFFSTPGMGSWNPNADFNGDNTVDFGDLNQIKLAFFGVPGPSGLPNPCAP